MTNQIKLNRRRIILGATSIAFGTASGCSSVQNRNSDSWEEAFEEETSEADRGRLEQTPIIVDQIDTQTEVQTALGVLGWNLAVNDAPNELLKNLERMKNNAVELRDELIELSKKLEKGLILVEEMKDTSALGTSVWDVATTAAPSLNDFVEVTEQVNEMLLTQIQRLDELSSSTETILGYFSEIRSTQSTNYGQVPQSLRSVLSIADDIVGDLQEIQDGLSQIQTISADARDIADELPALGNNVASVYNGIYQSATALDQGIEELEDSITNRTEGLRSVQNGAADEANQRYSSINNLVTGSEDELDVMAIDTSVDAYSRES